MIFGRIEDIIQYKGISKWFDAAADFLLHTSLEELAIGKTEICGEHVFINVMEADTKNPREVDFEIHSKYWDIQIDIEGEEDVWIGTGDFRTKEAVNPATDFGTAFCKEYVSIPLKKGLFIICMNREPHKPTLQHGDCRHVRKCVIKVEA